APLLGEYAQTFIAQAPVELLNRLTGDGLARFLQERFAFYSAAGEAPFRLRLAPVDPPLQGFAGGLELVEVVIEDRPFLVDSVQAYFGEREIPIRLVIHPIYGPERDAAGALKAVSAADSKGMREVHLLFAISPPESDADRKAILSAVRTILHEVVLAVDDFRQVSARIDAHAAEFRTSQGTADQVAQLMDWFKQGNFLFLGYLPCRMTRSDVQPALKEGLGLFAPKGLAAGRREQLIAACTNILAEGRTDEPFLRVQETELVFSVHRRESVTCLFLSSQRAGEDRLGAAIVGLFSDHSGQQQAITIPVARKKLLHVIERKHLVVGSHLHKELLDFLDGLPKFELFRLTDEALSEMCDTVISLIDQPRLEIHLIAAEMPEALRILICVPGEQPDFAALRRARRLIESSLGCKARGRFTVSLKTFTVHSLYFFPEPPAGWSPASMEPIVEGVLEELQPRQQRLLERWREATGSLLPDDVALGVLEGLPLDYLVAHADLEVLLDLGRIAELLTRKEPQFALRRGRDGGAVMVLYGTVKHSLSRIMPVLTNMRLQVDDVQSYIVTLPESAISIQTFELVPQAGKTLTPEAFSRPMKELVLGVLAGRLENDPLNGLLVACGLGWREINLTMLLRDYLMQVGTVFTRHTINETLILREAATQALCRVFSARFDPRRPDSEREAQEAAADQALADALREIDNLTEDRIFKRLHNLIKSTVRTNYYRDESDPVLAMKLHCPSIDQLPAPQPLYEIVVRGPLMEGTHLRAGPIARGGIRYSDRPDDFRTEVLGLMSTQLKKNAIIVPTGAKGGFVVKSTEPYGGDARAAGDAQYQLFMRALLSVTDNRVDGVIVPPPGVVRHDGDDPYLVVAADKGTAHLSDTANAISLEVDFWLGDAFASGGSNGFDHKQVGITARGAWESVKRHFWERGTDVQRQPVRVVGIGDMSGDVFGNGMLLSPCIELVAAFNHRHIFLDPHPDPDASLKERRRLFETPGSTWADYNPQPISEGGGVFLRSAKAVPLSPQVQAMLGTGEAELSGEALIHALLGMQVDLLWNGGIGTYIKAADETHGQVGDSNNDSVRLDATECRARVIAEGGNLGITQAARNELSLAGVLLNTDAIDNSGGVDMSDHEVNLKILLGGLLEEGKLPNEEARNRLLHELEPEITAAVLWDNALQAIVLSADVIRSQANPQPFIRLIDLLASEGGLDRRLERIPSTQSLMQIQAQGAPLPRPLLAVLLQFTKIAVFERLVSSPLVGQPEAARYFTGYFPRKLVERYEVERVTHPLRTEIVGTVLANRVVNQAGMTFVPELAAFTGKAWWEVVRAYLLADEILQAEDIRGRLYEEEFKLHAALLHDALTRLEAAVARTAQWLLLNLPPERHTFALPAEMVPGYEEFLRELPAALTEEERTSAARTAAGLRGAGMERSLAEAIGRLPFLDRFMEVCRLLTDEGLAIPLAMSLERLMEDRFRFRALEGALAGLMLNDPWQKQFGDGLLRTILRTRQDKLEAILQFRDGHDPGAWADAYLDRQEAGWSEYRQTLQMLLDQPQKDLISLAVVV
ncbi:MAG: NAD-glutamate dehydrogenase domain-containing protein, partial [bacterium]